MTKEQILLVQLLLGKALDAILTDVSKMTPEQVKEATSNEEVRTEQLLNQMRNI